ncbi:DUF2808 domain-containing protein [Egbenema bharatensis]|uniref:DUF2808 domain-containing protein n=1 Tax=Egbenema bharatensis TaxID=3463334 RepID=UPI003A868793
MRSSICLSLAVAASLTLGAIGLPVRSTQAVELQDGQTYFVRPPMLDDITTTQNTVLAWRPTYYFTLTMFEDAGESLGRVEISQRDGSSAARLIRYSEDTIAFEGTPRNRGNEIPVRETRFDRESQTVTVIFDSPVPPATVVTVGLKPQRNPRLSGVYLFGVTAYPEAEFAAGQFLGYGRLSFYGRENRRFPFF